MAYVSGLCFRKSSHNKYIQIWEEPSIEREGHHRKSKGKPIRKWWLNGS